VLYQYLLDDVARKQINLEQLKKMQKGEEVDYIEDRQGNNNINKENLIRTLSSKAPNAKADNIRMHNMARALRHDAEDGTPSSPIGHAYQPTTFGATVEREPISAASTDSKRLTM